MAADHRPAQQERRDRNRADRPTEWEVEVFDILNAGPRHRFTAAGLLVSNCLIVDLVGVTGLGDCASTVQIYSEGLPDEIEKRAEDILAQAGLDGSVSVEDAISQAKREDEEAKRRAKEERERAEQRARDQAAKRAKADAQVDYTSHDAGSQRNVDANEASEKMYRWIASLGLTIRNTRLTKKQAWRIVDQLMSGEAPADVAYTNGIDETNWDPCGPSAKQQFVMRGLDVSWVRSPSDASYVISAKKNPVEFVDRVTKDMDRAKTHKHLDAIGRRLLNTKKSVQMGNELYSRLVAYGRTIRFRLGTKGSDQEF